VKVLLDECLPHYLKKALAGHSVQTVQEAGWSGIKNGELLTLADLNFDAFVTADQNLRYQQNLAGRIVAVVELPTNKLSVVKTLVPEILSALSTIRRGNYIQIERQE
jgi:hypothetical protein